MKTTVKTLTKDGKTADYNVVTLETMEELFAQFEGKIEDLLAWASPNLPVNRNEYQKARLSTEPPIRAFASSAYGLYKTGLAQFATIEACVAALPVPEEFRERVVKMADERRQKNA
jgi:hypothetical protein